MEIIVRAALMFVFLFVVSRGTGKRELTQLTAFELILLVTMGDLVQQGVTQEDMSITGAFLAVGTMAFLVLATGWVSFKFRGARRVLEGVPVVIVDNGEFIDANLRAERVALDEVKEAARHQGIADLADVRLAVLEPDGRISFIRMDDAATGADDEPRAV